MEIFRPDEVPIARALATLATSNPFLPQRVAAERAVLGADYRELAAVWSSRSDIPEETPNIRDIRKRAEALAGTARERLIGGAAGGPEALGLYADVAFYVLYERYRTEFRLRAEAIIAGRPDPGWGKMYESFRRDYSWFLEVPGVEVPDLAGPAHLFAFFFQVRRAFANIFYYLVGASLALAKLRAAVWESIFGHDLRRYVRALYLRMADLNTLVTGPSGTGKELVARAIARSRYLPWDPKTATFGGEIAGEFHAVNIAALSPTLIESELFGHRKGAFTGAIADRAGWFEVCGPTGAVFLDEIGELEPALQVKLLRVLEARAFVPLGDSRPRSFRGKAIAATNRDLAAEMRAGRFREDLYYRLCADVIRTPSLHEQLSEDPEEIGTFVRFLSRRLLPDGPELAAFVEESTDWIRRRLGPSYPWPGNVRELEQCLRNLLLRRDYRPAAGRGPAEPLEELVEGVRAGSLSADELLSRYAALVYGRTGSYEETGRRLGLDRRTVKRRVQDGDPG